MLPFSKRSPVGARPDWAAASLLLLSFQQPWNPRCVSLLKTGADGGMAGMEGRLKNI